MSKTASRDGRAKTSSRDRHFPNVKTARGKDRFDDYYLFSALRDAKVTIFGIDEDLHKHARAHGTDVLRFAIGGSSGIKHSACMIMQLNC